jgi:hypothetical protein
MAHKSSYRLRLQTCLALTVLEKDREFKHEAGQSRTSVFHTGDKEYPPEPSNVAADSTMFCGIYLNPGRGCPMSDSRGPLFERSFTD